MRGAFLAALGIPEIAKFGISFVLKISFEVFFTIRYCYVLAN